MCNERNRSRYKSRSWYIYIFNDLVTPSMPICLRMYAKYELHYALYADIAISDIFKDKKVLIKVGGALSIKFMQISQICKALCKVHQWYCSLNPFHMHTWINLFKVTKLQWTTTQVAPPFTPSNDCYTMCMNPI